MIAPADEPTGFAVRTSWSGTVATVTVRGEVDLATAPALAAELALVADRKPAEVLVDLAEVRLFDPQGLSALYVAMERLGTAVLLRVRGADPVQRRTFRIVGMSELLEPVA